MRDRARQVLTGYLLAVLVATPLAVGSAPLPVDPPTPLRHAAVDIYLDPHDQPLAAWQFELREAGGRMTVAGLEGGEHPAFAGPPLYDREAIVAGGADRLIAAAYSLEPADRLPVGRTRIATVHVRLRGESEPDFRLTLIAAGDDRARPIEAALSLRRERGPRHHAPEADPA